MKRKRNGLFYSKKEETINSISHGIGIAMGVIVSTLFLIKCYQPPSSLNAMSMMGE